MSFAIRLLALFLGSALLAAGWFTAPVVAQQADQPALAAELAWAHSNARSEDDYAAMVEYRPGYGFWQYVFTIPDGNIAFGSATDGRLLVVFPTRGNWAIEGDWKDPDLADLLTAQTLPRSLDDRRELVARLLEEKVGPVVHNPTRGNFLRPNVQRYGRFLGEWAAIYERFGVPADIGLAQVALESGFHPTRRSAARAVGFCQWLLANWRRLNRLAPAEIEGHNQTTQAPYCAAYLSVLATKYGSFIPALSEHNSGGTNVGRTLINGARLGGDTPRGQYLIGSQFARDMRLISVYGFRDLYRTYGPRSYFYSEMVFGNTRIVSQLRETVPQVKIHAMRTTRAIPLAEVTKQTGLSVDEVKRFNPALLRRVPARGTLYLPTYVKEFGSDVAFWHRPPSDAFAATLNDFLRIDVGAARWDVPTFEPVLRDFQRRFAATNTEEGSVMATVLAYAIDETYSSRRSAILADFRDDDDVRRLFDRAVLERATAEGLRRVAADGDVTAPAEQ